jgi:hypothetical protein
MTNEQINAAIADACEWGQKPVVNTDGKGGVWVTNCPNYCADLNAMHEAEKVLTAINQPARGCSERGAYLSWLGYCGENNTSEVYECVTATARQRAEAFLKTLGKWEEGE